MQKQSGKIAIILGATGLTGSLLLQRLMANEQYASIKVFTRRKLTYTHPKLHQYIGDVMDLNNFKTDFYADELYCCIGTTRAKTPNKQQYTAIDYGIPVQAAKLAKAHNIGFLAVISAMGANANSCFFYNRTKGKMEQDILAQKLAQTYILRPSLIMGKRTEVRTAEDISNIMLRWLNPFLIGKLKDYRSINAEQIAYVMSQLSSLKVKASILSSAHILALSKEQ